MSIEVSCQDCEMSYRLPDRYAVKRCRCRECGTRIRVPGERVKGTRKKKGNKARAGAATRTAQRTTRRLNSQEQDILNDRRVLRTSDHGQEGVSESLHQLSPMTLSGTLDLESSLPSGPPSSTPRARKRKRSRPVGPAKARKAAKAETEGKPAEPKKKKKQAKARARKADAVAKNAETPKKVATTKAKAERTKKTDAKKGKAKGKAKPTSKPPVNRTRGKRPALKGKGLDTLGRRGRRGGRDEETDVEPQGRDPVRMAAIIAGTLCLLVGLVLGMAIQGIDWGPSPEDEAREALESKLAFIDGSIGNAKWDVAVTELKALETKLEGLNLPEERAQIQTTLADVTQLSQAAAISDPYERLDAIKTFATHSNPRIRRGVVSILRPLAAETDEVDLLAHMCKDPDPEVATIAQQGLIAVGGPLAIPYLHEAVKTSGNGNKLGDVALERALEIDAPEIVPVLITALDVRKNAPAPVLRAILEHLYQIGEPSCLEAAKRFTNHEDASVREAAEQIVTDIGG